MRAASCCSRVLLRGFARARCCRARRRTRRGRRGGGGGGGAASAAAEAARSRARARPPAVSARCSARAARRWRAGRASEHDEPPGRRLGEPPEREHAARRHGRVAAGRASGRARAGSSDRIARTPPPIASSSARTPRPIASTSATRTATRTARTGRTTWTKARGGSPGRLGRRRMGPRPHLRRRRLRVEHRRVDGDRGRHGGHRGGLQHRCSSSPAATSSRPR